MNSLQCRGCAHPYHPTRCFCCRHTAVDTSSRASTSDSDRTRHTKDRDAPEKDGDKLRGKTPAAAAREGSNGLRQTKVEGVREGDSKKSRVDSKKVVVASGPDRGTSKSRVIKPSKEKRVANGRETTGTKNTMTGSSKTPGGSTVRSSKTPPAKEKVGNGKLPSAKQRSASPKIDSAKRGESPKSTCALSTSAVGKSPGPKPGTQCTAVDDAP